MVRGFIEPFWAAFLAEFSLVFRRKSSLANNAFELLQSERYCASVRKVAPLSAVRFPPPLRATFHADFLGMIFGRENLLADSALAFHLVLFLQEFWFFWSFV